MKENNSMETGHTLDTINVKKQHYEKLTNRGIDGIHDKRNTNNKSRMRQ